MTLTAPLQLSLGIAVGAAVAWAARRETAHVRLMRSFALWSLVALELLVVVPMGAYLLRAYPGWSLMYLVDVADLPLGPAYLAVTYPLVALVAFVVTARSLRRGGRLLAPALVAVGLALAVAVVFFGRAALCEVASGGAFQGGDVEPLPIRETPLAYLLAIAVPAWWLAVGVTLSRLRLLGTRLGPEAAVADPTLVRSAPAAGTRKLAKGRQKA